MKDGIYTSITNQDYHNIDCISSTFLKNFVGNPRLAYLYKTGKITKDVSNAMNFGTLLHQMILEQDFFINNQFCNEGEDRKKLENRNKHSYTDKERLELINEMYKLEENKNIRLDINNSLHEVSIISNGKKARLDVLLLRNDTILLGDLKSHSVNDISYLNTNSMKMSYHIKDGNHLLQLSWYKKLLIEIINRIKDGEDVINENNIIQDKHYNLIDNINTCLYLIQTQAPFDINKLVINENDLKNNCNIDNILQEINIQKLKHNGFESCWDTKSEKVLCFNDNTGF